MRINGQLTMLAGKMPRVVALLLVALIGAPRRVHSSDESSPKRVVTAFVEQDLRGARATPDGAESMSRLVTGSSRIAPLSPNSLASLDIVKTYETSAPVVDGSRAHVALEYAVIGTVDKALSLKTPNGGPILMRQTVTLERAHDGRWAITAETVPSPAVRLKEAVGLLKSWRTVSTAPQQKNLDRTLGVLEELCRKVAAPRRRVQRKVHRLTWAPGWSAADRARVCAAHAAARATPRASAS